MSDDDKRVLIYGTFPTLEAAERVGTMLVDRRLAACVNLIPGMIAIYAWAGKRQRDSEVVMIAKTRSSLAEAAIREARAAHPYSNPALVALPIEAGSADYLRWIGEETAGT